MSPRKDKRRYGRTAKDVRREGIGISDSFVPPGTGGVGKIIMWIRINGVDVAYSSTVQAVNNA
jgi:hypothetical protein